MTQEFMKRVVRMMLGTVLCALLFFLTFLATTKVVAGVFIPQELRQSSQLRPVDSDRVGLTGQPESGKPVNTAVVTNETPLQLLFVPDETGKLKQIYYTMLDCANVTLRFIEVPIDTRIVTSTELYKEMVKENASVPQIVVLSEIYSYFNSDAAYRFAGLALEEVVPVACDYYTIMPETVYFDLISEAPESYQYAQFFQPDLPEKIRDCGSLKAYLTGIWEQCESNLAVSKKLLYLETYEGLTNKRIFYERIPGEQHNNGYEINCGVSYFYPQQ